MTNEKPLEFGRIVATLGAFAALAESSVRWGELNELLNRHASGDWGELEYAEDRTANERAIVEGGRILSAYKLSDGTKIWIITEQDHSVTTVLLPEEYGHTEYDY
jgi:hypothetical protein